MCATNCSLLYPNPLLRQIEGYPPLIKSVLAGSIFGDGWLSPRAAGFRQQPTARLQPLRQLYAPPAPCAVRRHRLARRHVPKASDAYPADSGGGWAKPRAGSLDSARSSSREVGKKLVPDLCSVVYFNRGSLPKKQGPTGGPRIRVLSLLSIQSFFKSLGPRRFSFDSRIDSLPKAPFDSPLRARWLKHAYTAMLFFLSKAFVGFRGAWVWSKHGSQA